MANKYFTGTTGGLWSVVSNWDNLTFPTSSDDVFANGRTIYVDTNVTVLSLNNSAVTGPPAITAGGTFFVDYRCGNVSINTIILSGSASSILQTNLISGQTLNITGSAINQGTSSAGAINTYGLGTINIFGNISGSSNGAATTAFGMRALGSTTINIVGNIVGTAATGLRNEGSSTINITGTPRTTSNFGFGIDNQYNGKINIYDPSFANSTTTTILIYNQRDGVISVYSNNIIMPVTAASIITNLTNGTINLSGNCYGGISGTSAVYLVNNTTTGIVNIYGNVIASGRTASNTTGFINNASTGILNVFGNVIGGVSANTIAISNSSTGTINVTGDISGGTNTTNTPAIYSSTAGFINVSGNCVANSYPALVSTSTLATNVVGGLVFNTASTPYYAFNLKVTPTATTITSTNVTGGTKIFTTSGYTYGLPFSGNVRNGINYGYMNEYTGSMVVPSKNSVKIGTLFDTGTTYGEAILTINDLNSVFKSFSFTGI